MLFDGKNPINQVFLGVSADVENLQRNSADMDK